MLGGDTSYANERDIQMMEKLHENDQTLRFLCLIPADVLNSSCWQGEGQV